MKAAKKIYKQISELGTLFGLSFSCHETVGNKIMALDGIKRKLLIIDRFNTGDEYTVVSLDDVKKISVNKLYNSIKAGELKRKSIDLFLKRISLQFNFKNNAIPLLLSFYEMGNNAISSLSLQEKKARDWQSLLTKISGCGMKDLPAPVFLH